MQQMPVQEFLQGYFKTKRFFR